MTSDGFANLVNAFSQNMQLPAAFARLAELLRRLGDAEANHASQQSMACATAAANDNGRLVALFNGASSFIQTGSALNWGTATLTFVGGVANEVQSTTITGQTWVVDSATTPAVVFYTGGPRSSDVNAYNFNWTVDTFSAGSGFKISAATPSSGGVIAGDYTALWIGLS